HLFIVTEPEKESETPDDEKVEAMFASTDGLKTALHRERPFDDYARQPLLPFKLSQLGPGMACADVDRDGDEDLYVGASGGVPGSLYLNHGKGGFKQQTLRIFRMTAASEDMGALFFDADSDGDPDLYVVSGGVECKPEARILRDRLYINDGKGYFLFNPNSLPDLRDSGSVVAAADVDRDGDLDLFVGSRSIPGLYPLPPTSRLLVNEGGRFRDAAGETAPGLAEAGMVTSAIWSDIDRDGWPDLLVTYEWGPVAVWKNRNGVLEHQTEAAGLAGLTGWWNSIAGGDFDHDGDIDFVLGNAGLNTKYHASSDRPMRLYYGAMGLDDKKCVVEAQYEGDHLFPVRGKSC
ncbi:MAG: VCBS repeat-containing protein, partial [Verrucomicrobiota bacterium]